MEGLGSPLHVGIVLATLIGAIYAFVREKFSPDVTALLVLLVLVISGVLTPAEGFGGFSHPATISVAAVLVLSASLERTGVFAILARRVLAHLGRSETLFCAVLMLAVGTISAFINNTAAVAVFLPIVLETCKRTGARPGRLLLPLSYASMFGGMCTLIGTSTNIVVHEYARSVGLPGFTMFELARIGLPLSLLGFVYLLVVGRWLLPRGGNGAAATGHYGLDEYVVDVYIEPVSSWVGTRLDPVRFQRDHDLELLGIWRADAPLRRTAPFPKLVAGDRLRVHGHLRQVMALGRRPGLRLAQSEAGAPEATAPALAPAATAGSLAGADTGAAPDACGRAGGGSDAPSVVHHASSEATATSVMEVPTTTTAAAPGAANDDVLAEVVLLPANPAVGHALETVRLRGLYGATILGMRRAGRAPGALPAGEILRAGDALLLQLPQARLQALAHHPTVLVTSATPKPEAQTGRLIVSLVTLVAVVFVAAVGLLPIVTAASAGCLLLMTTGAIKPRQAYESINWQIIFMLAGVLALGTAIEKTGIASIFSLGLSRVGEGFDPRVALSLVYLLAAVMTEFMSNSATAALLVPVALATATQLGCNPQPFLVAVTIAASASFAIPVGYQTYLMVFGPGGYRFGHFVRVGLPLDILFWLGATFLIPLLWPLTG